MTERQLDFIDSDSTEKVIRRVVWHPRPINGVWDIDKCEVVSSRGQHLDIVCTDPVYEKSVLENEVFNTEQKAIRKAIGWCEHNMKWLGRKLEKLERTEGREE